MFFVCDPIPTNIMTPISFLCPLNNFDSLNFAGNHWDGQAKGLHHNTQKSGLFPAYKVEDVHDIAAFPTYYEEKQE